MKQILCMTAVLALIPGICLADAKQDATIRTEQDRDRNSIFYLKNAGAKPIVVRIESDKVCARETNARKPRISTYWVEPGQSARLGKQLARSDCRRSFKVVRARYQ